MALPGRKRRADPFRAVKLADRDKTDPIAAGSLNPFADRRQIGRDIDVLLLLHSLPNLAP